MPLFVHSCLSCGRQLLPDERHICTLCSAAIEPPVIGPDDFIRRFAGPTLIEAHHSLFTYRHDDPLSRMLRIAKYNNNPELIVTLSRLLVAHLSSIKALSGVDALVPVPMHWLKQILRGYNQTHYITREISRATLIPVVKGIRAVRGHTRLAGSSGQARAQALRGVFAPTSPDALSGMRVAIVDDVLTSGSTLSAAARAASDAGAASVITLSLAATPPVRPDP